MEDRDESSESTRILQDVFVSLESLLNLEKKHEMVTTISVEKFPGEFQTEQGILESGEKRPRRK